MEILVRKWISIPLCCVLVVGCAVGPNFREPALPATDRFTPTPLPAKTVSSPTPGGKAQYFAFNKNIPEQWWVLFHSTDLNNLINLGLANSPTLAAAKAALQQAQQNLQAEKGALWPSANLDVSGQRIHTNSSALGASSGTGLGGAGAGVGTGTGTATGTSTSTSTGIGSRSLSSSSTSNNSSNNSTSSSARPTSFTFSLYNVLVNVSYTLDVFGGIRRQIEGFGAQVDFERFEWEATYLTLTSNIVTNAITQASLQEQIETTQNLVREEESILHIMQMQLKLGAISRLNVLTQEALVAQTRASLPPLQKSLMQARDAMAVLIGVLPSQSRLPNFHLKKLHLPTKIPLTIPSYLVMQRPDVRAASALLHAASAQIGVATANMLPQITLNGSYGWTASSIGALFSSMSNVWSYGADIMQPLFEGGALIAKRRAAIAAYYQAAAQYRQTVLQAFQNVADVLYALEEDAKTLKAEAEAETAAQISLKLVRSQYKLGAVNYLSVWNAEFQYHQALILRIQAEAARYADTAALFQALGGGWWNRP